MQNNWVACPRCGQYNDINTTFCQFCGTALKPANYNSQNPQYNNSQPQYNQNQFPQNTFQSEPVSQTLHPAKKSKSKTNNQSSQSCDTYSLIAVVLGGLSLIVQFGGLLGSGAIVFAALAFNRHVSGRDRALAITGLVLGIISIICALWLLFYLSQSLNDFLHLIKALRTTVEQMINR